MEHKERILHFTCPKCQLKDLVKEVNWKEWKCPYCNRVKVWTIKKEALDAANTPLDETSIEPSKENL